jgi:hypothetical protein
MGVVLFVVVAVLAKRTGRPSPSLGTWYSWTFLAGGIAVLCLGIVKARFTTIVGGLFLTVLGLLVVVVLPAVSRRMNGE